MAGQPRRPTASLGPAVLRGSLREHLGMTPGLGRGLENATVIYPMNATWPIGQHGLDDGPFMIVEFVGIP